eukprot:scaffold123539_cov16-Tisochrysis_lutea.AAC.2
MQGSFCLLEQFTVGSVGHLMSNVAFMSMSPLQEWARNVTSGKLSKGDRLGVVDHRRVVAQKACVHASAHLKCVHGASSHTAAVKLGALQVNYGPFRKNFYIEVAEIARMSDEEVVALRKELDGIKVGAGQRPRLLIAYVGPWRLTRKPGLLL